MFYEEVKEKKTVGRGAFGMTKGRRNKRPRLDDKIKPAVMTIHKADGSRVEVPESFFSKKDGSLKKSKLSAYQELLNPKREELKMTTVVKVNPDASNEEGLAAIQKAIKATTYKRGN